MSVGAAWFCGHSFSVEGFDVWLAFAGSFWVFCGYLSFGYPWFALQWVAAVGAPLECIARCMRVVPGPHVGFPPCWVVLSTHHSCVLGDCMSSGQGCTTINPLGWLFSFLSCLSLELSDNVWGGVFSLESTQQKALWETEWRLLDASTCYELIEASYQWIYWRDDCIASCRWGSYGWRIRIASSSRWYTCYLLNSSCRAQSGVSKGRTNT